VLPCLGQQTEGCAPFSSLPGKAKALTTILNLGHFFFSGRDCCRRDFHFSPRCFPLQGYGPGRLPPFSEERPPSRLWGSVRGWDFKGSSFPFPAGHGGHGLSPPRQGDSIPGVLDTRHLVPPPYAQGFSGSFLVQRLLLYFSGKKQFYPFRGAGLSPFFFPSSRVRTGWSIALFPGQRQPTLSGAFFFGLAGKDNDRSIFYPFLCDMCVVPPVFFFPMTTFPPAI